MNSISTSSPQMPATLAVKLPMVGIETCKSALGISEDAVLALIDDGKIRWAWNFSAQSSHARFVRVLTRSLLAYQQPGLDQPKAIEAVADLLLPLTSKLTGKVKGTTLQVAFNVSSTHVINLVAAGMLEARTWKRGPNGSPVIARASVVRLLGERRLP